MTSLRLSSFRPAGRSGPALSPRSGRARNRRLAATAVATVALTLPASPAETGPEPAPSAPTPGGRAPQTPERAGSGTPPELHTVRDRPAGAVLRMPAPAAPHTIWDRLADCESNGEWDYGPHSGWGSRLYEGGLQFHPATWDAFRPDGYPDAAYHATRAQQIAVAERLLELQGWKAWPACSRELNLR